MCNFLRIIFVAVFMSAASSSLFDFQRQFISRSAFFPGPENFVSLMWLPVMED